MWTTENRSRYDRRGLRYPSDMTDAEWVLIAVLIPPAERGGNARTVDLCEVVKGLLYVLGTGTPVACNPEGPAAAQHAGRLLHALEWDGTLGQVHHALYVLCREQAGREASPTATIIASRRVWRR
jgi:transposase